MFDDKKLYAELGDRIRRLRRAQAPEMNQEKLAKILGLTRTSVTNIESGKQKITVDTLYRLCEEFSVEVSDLLPKLADVVVVPSKQVVVGGQSIDVPAKVAGVIKTLRPTASAAGNKTAKK
jgi:transcriptional regulator with XRE-family HTH domain